MTCAKRRPFEAGFPGLIVRLKVLGTVETGVRSEFVKSGSGEDLILPRSLTNFDLHRRSVMAIQLNCGRAASASCPEPAGHPGSGFPSDPFEPLAPGERLQWQLDELAAIRCRLHQLSEEWAGALEPALGRPAAIGDFLLLPEVWRFRRLVTELESGCAALALVTQARLDRARTGARALRDLALSQGGHHGH